MRDENKLIPEWRLDQVRESCSRMIGRNFANEFRYILKNRGWKYDAGNNEFEKSGIILSFFNGYGSFNRKGCDGSKSEISHVFNLLPFNFYNEQNLKLEIRLLQSVIKEREDELFHS